MEYAHRLFTLLVACLVIFNAWRSWRLRRGDRTVARLALASVLLLFLQAGFGAWIVVGKLPAVFTVVDIVNSMILLAVLAALTAVGVQETCDERLFARSTAARGAIAEVTGDLRARARALRLPSVFVAAVVFVQIAVGAYFRHSGDGEALFGHDAYLRSHFEYFMPSYPAAVAWLMFHMMIGVAATGAIVWLLAQSVRVKRHVSVVVALAAAALCQFIFGFASLADRLALWTDTAHFAGGALMAGCAGYLLARVLIEAVPERALRRKRAVAPHAGWRLRSSP